MSGDRRGPKEAALSWTFATTADEARSALEKPGAAQVSPASSSDVSNAPEGSDGDAAELVERVEAFLRTREVGKGSFLEMLVALLGSRWLVAGLPQNLASELSRRLFEHRHLNSRSRF